MADAEARREARRRKILQNSESRMNRLLGNASVDERETVSVDPSPAPRGVLQVDSQSETPETSVRTTLSSDQQLSAAKNETPQRVSINRDSTSNEDTQFLTAPVRQRKQCTTPAEKTERQPDDSVAAAVAGQKPTESSLPTENARNGVNRSKVQPDFAAMDPLRLFDLLRCGGCLLVAFLTRWALSFGLGILFFEFVLVPFILLEASLFYFQTTHMKDIQLPHKSSMMAYALLLSGVKQDVITKYNSIMGYISAATEDFALFLFSFLLCHAVMA